MRENIAALHSPDMAGYGNRFALLDDDQEGVEAPVAAPSAKATPVAAPAAPSINARPQAKQAPSKGTRGDYAPRGRPKTLQVNDRPAVNGEDASASPKEDRGVSGSSDVTRFRVLTQP